MKNILNTYKIKGNEVVQFLKHIKFKKIKKNDNILIYGISRGGTTLMAQILVDLFKARLIWEPLFVYREVALNNVNPYSVKEYSDLGMGWEPHVNSSEDNEVNRYFDRLFGLKVRNIRYLRFTNHKKFKDSQHTIFKFCFGNFMYPYFQERYGFKSIILLRHPFAIAASSLGFGDNFNWHKDNFKNWSYNDSKKSGDFFSKYEDKYHLITSAFTMIVFNVVAQFSYALEHANKQNSIVVFYEDLVLEPQKIFKKLNEFFEAPLNEDQFLKLAKKQSFSSKNVGHTKRDPLEQLSKWKNVTSIEDVNDSLKIFEAFNFNVYSEDVVPKKETE